MDNSSPENGQSTPELSPADLQPPKRRSVRRRLVQSTLFPQKPQLQGHEENGHVNSEKSPGGDEDGNNGVSGEDEDCSGSQKKRKRKPRAKTTPKKTPKTTPTKRSSGKSKSKRSCCTTPKKNLANLLDEEVPIVIPDLRLEAKITAEENSRIFAGRQVHPFFSSCKVSKKNQELTDVEGKQTPGRAKKEIICGPIHVFERTQDNDLPLDWRSWTFNEGIFTKSKLVLGSMSSSTAQGSVECLCFDKLPITSHPSGTSAFGDEVIPEQCSIQDDCICETVPRTSVISEDVNMLCSQSMKGTEDSKINRVDFSVCIGELQKPVIEQESKFLEERMKSYYFCSGNQPSNALWTYKYQPKLAMEVCGNEESVKFLSGWLQHWHGKDLQVSQDVELDVGNAQDEDYICSENDSDADNKAAEATAKNVLLVTGPVGSGKSAAIYACAREQGFEVLEVSASDCRNGSLVKQRFGEALKSHQVKRSLVNSVSSPNKCNTKPSAQVDGTVIQDSNGSVPDEDCHATGGSGIFHCKEAESFCQQNEIKPIILFEDVDITFLEDRGFIAAIHQISETGKGPIILTSNSHDPLLPDNLHRLQIYFSPPSPEDLLCHLHKICAAENANIEPLLLDQILHFCEGDIRKAIMHLQFWCQRNSTGEATIIQRAYGSLRFDLESSHRMLPKLLPWGLPSLLAELVDKEITDSLSREEDVNLMEAIEEEESDQQELNHAFMDSNETEAIDAKKAAMLSRNWSADEYDELRAENDTAQELSDNSDTPFSCFRRNSRKQHETVLSSDSEDELANNGCIICPDSLTDNVTLVEESQSLNDQPCSVPADMDAQHYHCMEPESCTPITKESKSLDVSCVPESSFVPETVISNGEHLQFRTAFGNYANEEVSVSNGVLVEAGDFDLFIENTENGRDTLLDSQNKTSEYCHEDEEEDLQNEPLEAISTGFQVMDESSCVGYRRLTKFVEKPKPLSAADLVQNSWNKLRNSDLEEYLRSEEQHGLQLVNLTLEVSNLMSETDILLSRGQILDDSVEPSPIPFEESDVYNLYDTCALASTTVEHGFCHYAKSIAAIGTARGSVSTADMASEMLMSRMASSKLAQHDIGTISSELRTPKTDMSSKSEIRSTLIDVLQSIIPTKSYATFKGAAFYEYLSSLRRISKSEVSRLSQGSEFPGKRRRRADRHYLSTSRLMLSPEAISSLGQINTYRDISSHQDKSV